VAVSVDDASGTVELQELLARLQSSPESHLMGSRFGGLHSRALPALTTLALEVLLPSEHVFSICNHSSSTTLGRSAVACRSTVEEPARTRGSANPPKGAALLLPRAYLDEGDIASASFFLCGSDVLLLELEGGGSHQPLSSTSGL
jgi:hypothetical protein